MINIIVLLNMLIAMMSNSYAAIAVSSSSFLYSSNYLFNVKYLSN